MVCARPSSCAAATLLAAIAFAGMPAAAVERVDSTLPNASTPPVRGERVLQTRPQREASAARLAQDLARDAELRRLAGPPPDPWAPAGPWAPGWLLPGGPCLTPGCPPPPVPGGPAIRIEPAQR